MHIFCGCELPEEAIYSLIYETASGKRVFTNGWLIDASGAIDTVTVAEHDLRFDRRRLLGGTLRYEFASGATRELAVEAEGRLWMEMVGYSSVPERNGPGGERLDLADPAVGADTEGFNDNATRFECAGAQGHGFVETGLGVHARYLPEDGAT
jgi:hypothetical protein